MPTQEHDEIFTLTKELQVMSNQLEVRTEVVCLAALLNSLRNIESRLSAIEINTMNLIGLPSNEPTASRTPEPKSPTVTVSSTNKT